MQRTPPGSRAETVRRVELKPGETQAVKMVLDARCVQLLQHGESFVDG